MSGTTPELSGQDGQHNDQNGAPTPPVSMPPLPPLPWEQQPAAPQAAPAAPHDPYAARAAQGGSYDPYAARATPGTPHDPAAPQQPAPAASGQQPAAYGAQPTAPYGAQPTGQPAAQPTGQPAAPYGQQPGPYGTQPAYGAPQPAAYGSQPAPYGTQPYGAAAQPAKRKGMPTWAWWTIGVGAVVVLGAVVAVVAVINLVMPYTETAGPGEDTGTSDTDTGDTGTGDTGAGSASADYPLTAVMDAPLELAFAVPGLEGWSVSDQDDFYTFAEHETDSCVFEAQTMDLYGADPAAADDAAATAADFPAYFEEIGMGTEIVDEQFTEVGSVALESSAGTIEFATFDSTLTWSDGSEYLERWYFRSLVDSGATMYAYLSCPAEDFTSATLGETIDALSID
ncbi:hypothetical protein [Microbacterium sediminis]|uniref:hypothetical protein n=1 Tax=Microbacterium sediminis TaxID=904291 RepID=UPI001071EB7C|nr:hypothetical protein [Microbacterium sediminis]QBR75239.1 hypothetical protein E3O41_13090 [Microbacterium sediminis]